MKLNKLIAIPAIAITAGLGLSLTACGSSGGSSWGAQQAAPANPAPVAAPASPAPASLTPGTATIDQICHAVVGTTRYGYTVASVAPAAEPWGSQVASMDGNSGDAVTYCWATLSDGFIFPPPGLAVILYPGPVGTSDGIRMVSGACDHHR